MKKLPKIALLYLDYVLRFFDKSNFKGWPDKIETITYHWKNDKKRFIEEVKKKKIEIIIGNIPATAYESFIEISKALPNVRFVPSLQSQFSNRSKENVTLFCKKNNLSIPFTKIFYNKKEAFKYFDKKASYPQIIKKSYGPSNYGGYYVHKVNNSNEAKKLIEKTKYNPIYSQNAIELKHKGDIRIMLIGHKPVCAFWRFSEKGQWITNTSQGGSMSYNNIPMNAIELAVKASKAAKAEYWACDIAIDKKTDKAYILECATAFAAFPYIRDWICQYLMWDFSNGRFPIPNVPLFSWEELGKINSNLLRTMRHISFSKYTPSCDGTLYIDNSKDKFSMKKVKKSTYLDFPSLNFSKNIVEDKKTEKKSKANKIKKIDFNNSSLTDIMSLHGMEEELAIEIQDYSKSNIITDPSDLLEIESINEQMIHIWNENIDDMRIDINKIDETILKKVKGIGSKLSQIILNYKKENKKIKDINELKKLEGIGKNKLAQIKSRFKVGE